MKKAFMPKSVVEVREKNVLFSVLNPTSEAVTLKKNTIVASIQPIESVIPCDNTPVAHNHPDESDQHGLPDYLRPLVDNASSNLSDQQRQQLTEIFDEILSRFYRS
jgi:hypothetical protein